MSENKEKIIKQFVVGIAKAITTNTLTDEFRIGYHHPVQDESENMHDFFALCLSISIDILKNRTRLYNMDMGIEVEQDEAVEAAVQKMLEVGDQIHQDYFRMKSGVNKIMNELNNNNNDS